MASSNAETDRRTPQGVPYSTLPHMVNADGQYLFCRTWEPTLEPGQKPRALHFHCHGMRGHCGLTTPVLAQLLTEHGILVFSHDYAGHGQSEGICGDQMDLDVFTRDVLQHVAIMAAKYPGVPVFLSGQSLGGAVAIRASLQRPELFAGMLLLAPGIKTMLPTWLMLLGSIAAWIFPETRFGSPQPLMISKHPESQMMYANDPFIFKEGLKLRAAQQVVNGVNETRDLLQKVECPFLVLHGENDRITDIVGSRQLHEQAKSQDKTIKTYPNCLHSLLLETPDDVKIVKQDIMDWLLPRVDRAHVSSS